MHLRTRNSAHGPVYTVTFSDWEMEVLRKLLSTASINQATEAINDNENDDHFATPDYVGVVMRAFFALLDNKD